MSKKAGAAGLNLPTPIQDPPVAKKTVKAQEPVKAPEAQAQADGPKAAPAFGDRVIRLRLTPTRGHDGRVVSLLKDFPRSLWSDEVYEDWGMVIDEGDQEHAIAAITLNLLKGRQEINLAALGVESMGAAVDKYTALGWSVEDTSTSVEDTKSGVENV